MSSTEVLLRGLTGAKPSRYSQHRGVPDPAIRCARPLRLGHFVAQLDKDVLDPLGVLPKIVPTDDTTRYTPITEEAGGLIGGVSEVVLGVGWVFGGA